MDKAGYTIDWAQPADADRLVPLLVELYRHDVPEAPLPNRDTVLRHIGRLLAPDTPHRLAIARSGSDSAVGLAAVALFQSVSDPRPERWVQMELKELFVLPDHRGGGLGTALMNWIAARAAEAGACRIDWHVRRENARGIAFYQRQGAQIVEGRMSMRKPVG